MPDVTPPVGGGTLFQDPSYPRGADNQDFKNVLDVPSWNIMADNTTVVGPPVQTFRGVRVIPDRAFTVRFVRVPVCVAAGADDVCQVGIYDALGDAVTRSVAAARGMNSIGVKAIPVPEVTLKKNVPYYVGLYFNAFAAGLPTVCGCSAGASGLIGKMLGDVPPDSITTLVTGIVGGLPASIVHADGGTVSQYPRFVLTP